MGLYQDVLESADGGVFINLRDAAGTGITSTLVSAKQALDVYVANSLMVGVADESAFSYGSSSYQPIGGVYNSSITNLTSGQGGVASLTAYRDLRVNLRTSGGVELGNSNADGMWMKPGDGTNVGSYSATSEEFVQLRQGGNVANVNAANELLVNDSNSFPSSSAALTQVPGAITSSSLLAPNAARKGFMIQNATNKILYIAMAATATVVAYSASIQSNSVLELNSINYQGDISAISPAGVSGNVIVTEFS